jgi:hypothetical protein
MFTLIDGDHAILETEPDVQLPYDSVGIMFYNTMHILSSISFLSHWPPQRHRPAGTKVAQAQS